MSQTTNGEVFGSPYRLVVAAVGFRYVIAAMTPVAMVAASAKFFSSGLLPPRIDRAREVVDKHREYAFD